MQGNVTPRYVAVYDPLGASQSNIAFADREQWPVYRADGTEDVAGLKRELAKQKVTALTNFTLDVMHPTLGFLSEAAFMQEYDNKLPSGKLVVRIRPQHVEATSEAAASSDAGNVTEAFKPRPASDAAVAMAAAEIANAVVSRLRHLMLKPDPIDIEQLSHCNSNDWTRLLEGLHEILDLHLNCHAPCCLATSVQALAAQRLAQPPVFRWTGQRKELTCNVQALKAHLQRHFAPPGVVVIAVERVDWLAATIYNPQGRRIRVGGSGDGCRTDFVFMLKAGEYYMSENDLKIDGAGLRELLPYIVGLYEAKMPGNLTATPIACKRQAFLEYLAVNTIHHEGRRLVVVLGDGNRHYCVHPAYDEQGQANLAVAHMAAPETLVPPLDVSLARSPLPAAVQHSAVQQRASPSAQPLGLHAMRRGASSSLHQRGGLPAQSPSSQAAPARRHSARTSVTRAPTRSDSASCTHLFVKAVLTRAAADAQTRLAAAWGLNRQASVGSAGPATDPSSSGVGGSSAGLPCPSGGMSAPGQHATGNAEAAGGPSLSSGAGLAQVGGGGGMQSQRSEQQQVHTQPAASGEMDVVDAGVEEAACDNAFAQAIVHLFDRPEWRKAYNIPLGADVSITPASLDEYAASFRG